MNPSSRIRPDLCADSVCLKEESRLELQPILDSDLAAVAAFLHRSRTAQALQTSEHPQPVSDGPLTIERRLRWLVSQNPIARDGYPRGYRVVDDEGAIRGVNLHFPSAFLTGQQRLYGLASGSWFVDSPARSTGFYLFKKYLSTPGYAFYFATTCNRNSEPLWRALGGRPVPNSETEYIVPFHLDVVIPAFVGTRTSNPLAREIARTAGRCVNPVLEMLTRRSSALTIEPCQDWEKLAALFRRTCPEDRVVSDRSAEFLEWRYGPSSPAHPCRIYVFRDGQGNEGWFCLADLVRSGVQGPLLLDVVWPRDKMNFKDIFQEIAAVADSGADALFLRRQPGFDSREFCAWAVPHKLDAYAFVIDSKCHPQIPLEAFDYDDNDYLAWMFDWPKDNAIGGPFGYGL